MIPKCVIKHFNIDNLDKNFKLHQLLKLQSNLLKLQKS